MAPRSLSCRRLDPPQLRARVISAAAAAPRGSRGCWLAVGCPLLHGAGGRRPQRQWRRDKDWRCSAARGVAGEQAAHGGGAGSCPPCGRMLVGAAQPHPVLWFVLGRRGGPPTSSLAPQPEQQQQATWSAARPGSVALLLPPTPRRSRPGPSRHWVCGRGPLSLRPSPQGACAAIARPAGVCPRSPSAVVTRSMAVAASLSVSCGASIAHQPSRVDDTNSVELLACRAVVGTDGSFARATAT